MAHPTDDVDLLQQTGHATASSAGDPPHCANCQAPLGGAYCAVCGQARHSPIVSVRAFTAQLLDDVASVDSRLVRTVRALFFRPGQLTREYLEGRRTRYTGPVQLYLVAAATFFLVASFRPFVWIDTARLQVVGELPGMTIGNEVVQGRLRAVAGDPAALELFSERFVGAVTGFLPVFLIVSILLFSLALYGVNRRHESRYLPHAIFALHWTAFYLLLIAASRLFPAGWHVEDISLLPALLYLTLALRQVYGDPPLRSLGKAAMLVLAFLLILATWVQAAIVVGLTAV